MYMCISLYKDTYIDTAELQTDAVYESIKRHVEGDWKGQPF